MRKTKMVILCALFAILTAIGAQIRIPFPIVPITFQTLVVMLSGLLLGARAGAVSQVFYLFIGLVGLPVFAGGGGINIVAHPTFGFLIGFIPGAYVAGYIGKKPWGQGSFAYLPACFVSAVAIYICGLAGLYLNLNFLAGKAVTFWAVVKIGLLPFIPGAIVKFLAASFITAKVKPLLESGGVLDDINI